ncbi:von Willebrand factor, partial [Clarias magur]
MVSLAPVPRRQAATSRGKVPHTLHGERAERLRLTFIGSSWSTSGEQQPSVTRSRCHRLSASERAATFVKRELCACVKGETPCAR